MVKLNIAQNTVSRVNSQILTPAGTVQQLSSFHFMSLLVCAVQKEQEIHWSGCLLCVTDVLSWIQLTGTKSDSVKWD